MHATYKRRGTRRRRREGKEKTEQERGKGKGTDMTSSEADHAIDSDERTKHTHRDAASRAPSLRFAAFVSRFHAIARDGLGQQCE